ncbi:MAG: rhodanese-like domain-containing protein [Betaproteobacteria bacterium]|nr:rhodanese-like domain-containing protein [Betaproteobacteria bacterium]
MDFAQFVKNNLLMFVVAIASGGMLLWPFLRRGAGGPWVNAVQATQLINREDAIVVDVREPAEFAQGHILSARNLPMSQLGARVGELDKYKSRAVVLCCATGNRSSRAIAMLKSRGFEKACNLSGGLSGWQQAGLPVEK